MTRFIEREQKTQVNSNIIGVQVRPQVVPPTYEVNDLLANVGMNLFGCTYTSNDDLPMLYVNSGSGDEIWAYTGSQEEYNGTVYKVWSCVMGSVQGVNFLTDSNDSITDQTQFYIHPDAPDAPPVIQGPRSDYMLQYGGDLYRFDPNGYYYVSDGDFVQSYLSGDATCDLVDGFFVSKSSGRYLGQFTGTTYTDNLDFNCAYNGDDNGYAMWRVDYYGEIYLYSSIRNPSVGYNLVSNNVGTEAYTSRVVEVTEDEVDPGYTEAVDCMVEYSVDGETWTAWPENLTDDNNVIANIPRYMYLKFGQDVEITEE